MRLCARLVIGWVCCSLTTSGWAQEAESGFDLRGSISTEGMYSHAFSSASGNSPVNGGFQTLLYPTWKVNSHWSFSGAVQVRSQPYFREEYSDSKARAIVVDVVQANLTYSRFWKQSSLSVRVGQMTTAFGSFMLRYDPASNYVVDLPPTYGYYYKPVTSLGLLGAQVDATVKRFDLRAQISNSSPANPRTPFDHDQYATWTAGAGFTIQQGFRIGTSVYRGPYLDRQYPYFFRGEADPKSLPATAYGLDVQWGRGAWNASGELQHFSMAYHVIPTFTEHSGYAELRRTLTPRWYAATRISYLRASAFRGSQIYELVAGYRPNRYQLLKFGYQIQQGSAIRGTLQNGAVVQLVTTFHALSLAGK
ncbi:MAG: hypothetical protein ABI824_00030 [Acidobacteriota bacterium]